MREREHEREINTESERERERRENRRLRKRRGTFGIHFIHVSNASAKYIVYVALL